MENLPPNQLNTKLGNKGSTTDKKGPSSKQPPRSHGLNLSNFERGDIIADGSTSTIVEARTVRFTTARQNIPEKNVVLKCVPKYRTTARMRNFLRREKEVHLRVGSHPNISTMYASFEDEKGVYFVIERIRGPTLHELIHTNGKFPEKFALQVTDQILEGIFYMHSRGYSHRDLSPKNIMFREWPSPASGKLHVFLIDMGDASFRLPEAAGGERCSSEKIGTPHFTAPEVHRDPMYLPESCDMWSIGALMYFMIKGDYLHKDHTKSEADELTHETTLTLEGEIWDMVTERTKGIIRDLLLPMPARRPDVEKVKSKVEAALKSRARE